MRRLQARRACALLGGRREAPSSSGLWAIAFIVRQTVESEATGPKSGSWSRPRAGRRGDSRRMGVSEVSHHPPGSWALRPVAHGTRTCEFPHPDLISRLGDQCRASVGDHTVLRLPSRLR